MSEKSEQYKTAGITVYLMEELGDARMRCDQLLRYIEKAVKLVEKSSHKDHFFEVAGDVIRGIPETAFKLHKALEAVALAANRIDYEEIKQDLRPEKVEELERVLKDVRVRQVQRRSLPMLNPGSVVEQLRGLAKKAKEEGRLDTDGLSSLIASLETGAPKVAEDAGAKVSAQLEAMAHALENPPEGQLPSRHRLAQALRKTYAEHVQFKTAEGASNSPALVARMVRLAEGLDELGKDIRYSVELLGKDPRRYTPQLDNLNRSIISLGTTHRVMERTYYALEKFVKSARTASEEEKRSRFEEGKPADPTKDMDPEDAKEWKENTEEYGDKFKKEASKLTEDALLDLNTAIYGLKQISRGSGNPKRLLAAVVGSLSKLAAHLGQPDKVSAALDRVVPIIVSSFSVKDMLDYEKEEGKRASDDEKRSRFEEGKPADPTKHMDPEDAKEWKENTEEYGDKFKAASDVAASKKIPPAPDNVIEEIMSWHGGQGSNLYSVGSTWNAGKPVDADSAEEAYDELERHHADHEVLSDFKDHLREHGVRVSNQQKRTAVEDATFWKVA